MGRIEELFRKKKPFIAYVTAGDGGMERTVEATLALVEGGVDLLEVGIPFSDPVADGPVIQDAMERSLKLGTTPRKVLECIATIRKKSAVPIVLFTYYNPVLAAGGDFYKEAKAAGVDGILIVDLPLEEGEDYRKQAQSAGLDTIFLIAPSTPKERIQNIALASSGFLYYVSRKGTTGVKTDLPDDLEEKVQEIRSVTSLPVVVGFGVSNSAMARKILTFADGFVVGSYLVQAIGEGKSLQKLTQCTRSLIE